MSAHVLYGPYGQGTESVQHSTTPVGKQRSRCRVCPERERMLLWAYFYAGHAPEVKRQMVDMALHPIGMRDTARGLHVSPPTGMQERTQRHLSANRYHASYHGVGPARHMASCTESERS